MKNDAHTPADQRHVWLAAFGWVADGYQPRHAVRYESEQEWRSRGRHRAPRTRLQVHGVDRLRPLLHSR